MSQILKLSSDADSFPTQEVEYEDLLGYRYRVDARVGTTTSPLVDCLGVVLEIYRRAGLGLPDPKVEGASIWEFSELFDEVSTPDTLYDLVSTHRKSHHVLVVVRYGLAISATEKVGVYTRRTNVLKLHSGVKYYRVKTACLP